MLKAIPAPRDHLSKYAPKMLTLNYPSGQDKGSDRLGRQGHSEDHRRMQLQDRYRDDGSVFVSAINIDDANRAIQVIKTIAMDPEVGAVYKGKVTA
jgi:polyribonucleotide nucleotidyltransferase